MKKILLSFLMCTLFFCAIAQVDNPDCLDKSIPLFTPMDGFYVDWCKYSEFGTNDFPVDRGAGVITKEGIYREIWFRKKENNTRIVSGLQILRNHQSAIEAVGGKIEKRSDGDVFITTYNGKELWIYINASTYSENQDNYGILSIEVDLMKQEVSALDIKESIASSGKIALYGILFDTGKSDIKAESEKAIQTVATYLLENTEVNVYIVGHTDNIGDYTLNQKLSKARGESVKNYLVSNYNIPASRLSGDGVGSVCPVTSNDTAEGQALNRRVEIVKK